MSDRSHLSDDYRLFCLEQETKDLKKRPIGMGVFQSIMFFAMAFYLLYNTNFCCWTYKILPASWLAQTSCAISSDI